MSVLSKLNYVNLRDWRRFHWMVAYPSQISAGMISIYGSISLRWRYSGGEVGFIAAAAVLTSAAACGVIGLLLKNDARSHAPLRWKSGRAVDQAGSNVQGASDATAS